jgi:Ca-activated chloride channel family protein
VSELHHGFAHPWALLLSLVLPVLAVLGVLAARRQRLALAWLGGLPGLQALVAEGCLVRTLRSACLSTGLTLLALGVAGPQWGRDWDQPAAPGRDVVVVLDLSRSMLAEAPSRVQRAQEGLVGLSQAVQQRGGHRLALVVFAGRPKVLCPLTHDYDHFREAVQQLDAANPALDLGQGTRLGAALRAALELHDPRFQGHQDVLLLSDGDDPAGDEEWRAGAEEARQRQVAVHVVGVGNPNEGSPIPLRDGHQRYQDQVVLTRLEEKPLQEIARLTKGTYTPCYSSPPALGALFREQIEPRAGREDTEDALPVYQQRYAWFLGPALLFLALEMVIGRLRRGGPR